MKKFEDKEDYRRITTKVLYDNLGHFNEVYPAGKPENPVPENTHCFVYCSYDKDVEGMIEIHKTSDLGLEILIARNWITATALKKLLTKVK